MLKSTHRLHHPVHNPLRLPLGWTEHKAPNGHTYYWNAEAKTSTYTRPCIPEVPVTPQPYVQQPRTVGREVQDVATPEQYPVLRESLPTRADFGSGYGAQDRKRPRLQPQDRPRSKHSIPGCAPWVLVKTRLGRRFVHNTETKESLWKFPPEVEKGVIRYDLAERWEQERKEKGEADHQDEAAIEAEEVAAAERRISRPAVTAAQEGGDDSGDEYEEVEVTDDENEGDSNDPKRQKTEQDDAERPVEFDEDDIAYQLAAMGESYGLDPGEYGNSGEQGEWEEGAEGLPFTEEDAVALFEDMLDDRNVSPYTPWEKLIEPRSAILSDDRYTALSSTHARKKAWVDWSRKRLQRLKELRDRQEKLDPRIPYLSFLRQYATPKLYWPEFKRKYKKESVMKDTKLSDKDREKLYREHINRLKLPHSTLESDLLQLLRSIGPAGLNSSTNLSSLPSQLLTDLRYISLPTHTSDAIISDFIEKLAPAPEGITGHAETDEDSAKKVADRKRRAEALRDRERRVQEEKVRTEKEIKAGKWQLREREKELERANTSGKEGIRGMLNEMGGQGPT